MKKLLLTGAAAFFMTAAISMTSLAGQWRQDGTGWWYQNEDGSYVNNGWNWIDGKCYYFMADGYCLTGTQTPDGYTVDETGAWVVNGVAQTQVKETVEAGINQESVQVDTLSFTVPSGFTLESSTKDEVYYYNGTAIITVCSRDYNKGLDETWIATYQEELLDRELGVIDGIKGSKSIKQFPTGYWYCYDYPTNAIPGIPGNVRAYGRIEGHKIQLVMFAGAISGMDTDTIMYDNVSVNQ